MGGRGVTAFKPTDHLYPKQKEVKKQKEAIHSSLRTTINICWKTLFCCLYRKIPVYSWKGKRQQETEPGILTKGLGGGGGGTMMVHIKDYTTSNNV